MGYGTGAIMAVPAHDERDFDFARELALPTRDVVYPAPIAAAAWFLTHTEDPDAFPLGWDLALADFVALATLEGYFAAAYPSILRKVARRRDPAGGRPADPLSVISPNPGAVGERRGVVQREWIEALGEIIGMGFTAARDLFTRAVYWAHAGEAYTQPGVAANSPPIDGLPTDEAKAAITSWLEDRGAGESAVTYKLRDWLFSRQRYWGEPFPIVYDEAGLPVALPESMLPVELPELEDFAPSASDDPDAPPRPPLGRAEGWAEVTLDLGDGPKRYTRELNTMPQWAGSCWYYLRYLDPTNDRAFCDPANERYWMRGDAPARRGGVDLYVGGVEHAVLHLLYARFWHKILYDLGRVSTVEPFQRLFNQGYILAPAYRDARGVYVEAHEVEKRDGAFFFRGEPVTREFGKMGKSLKNSVTPDEICTEFGADTLRLYEMYMGPLEQSKPWNPRDIVGMHRMLQRIWRTLVDEQSGEGRLTDEPASRELRGRLHRTIAGVREDLEALRFNTAIAKINEFNNALDSSASCPREVGEALILMLAPLAPHVAEEAWRRVGGEGFVVRRPFPVADPDLLVEEEVQIAVQINGKVRGRVSTPAGADEEAHRAAALADPAIARLIEGKAIRKVIVAPGRLVNIVAT
ncbi:MAG: hypothetical protein D6693_08445 [Planctomycetota bacterium]|nr:MAG: hypothetical protein D6693_08445 [Planctomycetota bacterium]